MLDYKRAFIEFALAREALKFGQFTLKSGRQSPYFFNAGTFCSGQTLAQLGEFYADAIVDAGIEFDMLFGPAYKGIPLVAAVSIALAGKYDRDLPWAFNRKEAKDHGEGGSIVGASLAGRVLVIDDVITAGTAIREVTSLFDGDAARMAGVVVALDRQEKGQGTLSAIQEVERDLQIPVKSIVALGDIIQYLESLGTQNAQLEQMRAYRKQFGVSYEASP